MRALQLIEDRKLETVDVPPPPPPGIGEVTLSIKAVALNHIDVLGLARHGVCQAQDAAWSSARKLRA